MTNRQKTLDFLMGRNVKFFKGHPRTSMTSYVAVYATDPNYKMMLNDEEKYTIISYEREFKQYGVIYFDNVDDYCNFIYNGALMSNKHTITYVSMYSDDLVELTKEFKMDYEEDIQHYPLFRYLMMDDIRTLPKHLDANNYRLKPNEGLWIENINILSRYETVDLDVENNSFNQDSSKTNLFTGWTGGRAPLDPKVDHKFNFPHMDILATLAEGKYSIYLSNMFDEEETYVITSPEFMCGDVSNGFILRRFALLIERGQSVTKTYANNIPYFTVSTVDFNSVKVIVFNNDHIYNQFLALSTHIWQYPMLNDDKLLSMYRNGGFVMFNVDYDAQDNGLVVTLGDNSILIGGEAFDSVMMEGRLGFIYIPPTTRDIHKDGRRVPFTHKTEYMYSTKELFYKYIYDNLRPDATGDTKRGRDFKLWLND